MKKIKNECGRMQYSILIPIALVILMILLVYVLYKNNPKNSNGESSNNSKTNTTDRYDKDSGVPSGLVINSEGGLVEFKDGKSGLILGTQVKFYTLFFDGAPINVTSEVTWKSSNEDVVTVDNNGLVTGVSKGTAEITAEYSSEDKVYTDSYQLLVMDDTEYLNYEEQGVIQLYDGPDSPVISPSPDLETTNTSTIMETIPHTSENTINNTNVEN